MSSSEMSSIAHGVTKIPKVYSCVLCQQRKVKCDRRDPCSNCFKAGAQCISSTPAPPRRRKKKLSEAELYARLKKYEDVMKSHGLKAAIATDVESELADLELGDPGNSSSQTKESNTYSELSAPNSRFGGPDQGRLLTDHRNTKFLDNNLWTELSDEFRDPREMLQARSDDGERSSLASVVDSSDDCAFLLGSSFRYIDLSALHPQPVYLFRLWQIFLDNVNPICKIIHAPTVQHKILEASSHLQNLPKGLEALMFAIYASAVHTLSDEECQSMINETRDVLLTRYSTATQQALTRASLLKSSEITVLQAFVLFLLCMRQVSDPHALWILTGCAVRMGQRMGLHRDGSNVGLSVFESELRRRLWWQIILLDSRAAQLSGSGTTVMANLWDTKIPLNINDSDLSPEMQEQPRPHDGITEMVFCLTRYHFGEYLRTHAPGSGFDGNWQKLSSPAISVAEKDKTIDELESLIERKFLRYCDPLIPLHMLTAGMARSAICKMRLLAHHPRQYPDKGASLPQVEKDELFLNSLRMVEYDTLGHADKVSRRFIWHIRAYFQMDALVYLLSDLRQRTIGALSDKAWAQIEECYHYHTELFEARNALYLAIGNLTLRAWDARQDALSKQHLPVNVPEFILKLRTQRAVKDLLKSTHQRAESNVSTFDTQVHQTSFDSHYSSAPGNIPIDYNAGFDPSAQYNFSQMDDNTMDWDYWNALMMGNDGYLSSVAGQADFNFGPTDGGAL